MPVIALQVSKFRQSQVEKHAMHEYQDKTCQYVNQITFLPAKLNYQVLNYVTILPICFTLAF